MYIYIPVHNTMQHGVSIYLYIYQYNGCMYNIYIYMYKNRFICKSFSKSTFERYPRRLLLKCAAGMTKSAAFSPPARCVSIGKRTTRPEISEWPWIAAMFSLQNSQIASDKDAFFFNRKRYLVYLVRIYQFHIFCKSTYGNSQRCCFAKESPGV